MPAEDDSYNKPTLGQRIDALLGPLDQEAQAFREAIVSGRAQMAHMQARIDQAEQALAGIEEKMIRVLKPGGVLLVSELSAWVPFWSTLRAMRQTKLPWLLQPLIALSFRQETRKMMPPREVVEGWFVGHEDVDSDGVTHPSVGGAPAAFWFAYAVRRRNPGRSLGRGPA